MEPKQQSQLTILGKVGIGIGALAIVLAVTLISILLWQMRKQKEPAGSTSSDTTSYLSHAASLEQGLNHKSHTIIATDTLYRPLPCYIQDASVPFHDSRIRASGRSEAPQAYRGSNAKPVSIPRRSGTMLPKTPEEGQPTCASQLHSRIESRPPTPPPKDGSYIAPSRSGRNTQSSMKVGPPTPRLPLSPPYLASGLKTFVIVD